MHVIRSTDESVVNLSKLPLLFKGEFSLCRINNGGCQDLCLLTSEGRVNCSCRGDRKLLEDNTCSGCTTFFFKKKVIQADFAAALLNAFFCLSCAALNTTCNIIDEFECGNGDCINYTLSCDGMAHCKDKSDEKQSYCGKRFALQSPYSCVLVTNVSHFIAPRFLSQPTACAKRATGGA